MDFRGDISGEGVGGLTSESRWVGGAETGTGGRVGVGLEICGREG